MAVVPMTAPNPVDGVQYKVVEWTGLGNGDKGAPFVHAGRFRDITVYIWGTWGVGGKMDLHGTVDTSLASLSTVNVFTIRDALVPTNDFDSVAANLAGVLGENPHAIFPDVTAGDSSTDLTVRMVCREY